MTVMMMREILLCGVQKSTIYCWINDTGDYFAVEVDYHGDFSELVRCKSLVSAKRWVATHLLL